MRLFVAADVSADTRAHLRRARELIEQALPPRGAPALTWVSEHAAHVTLRFIGETAAAAAERLYAALLPPVALAPFDTRWGTLGSFPGGRRPRVIWLGALEGEGSLSALASLVAARLEPIVGAGEARRFHPHLTLARVRDPGRVDWRRLLGDSDAGVSRSRIDQVTLYRSRLSPKGAAYEALLRTPLEGELRS